MSKQFTEGGETTVENFPWMLGSRHCRNLFGRTVLRCFEPLSAIPPGPQASESKEAVILNTNTNPSSWTFWTSHIAGSSVQQTTPKRKLADTKAYYIDFVREQHIECGL